MILIIMRFSKKIEGKWYMTLAEVKIILEEHKNERGIAVWQRTSINTNLKSFGIGLTQLKKIAKQIGKNHELALELWEDEYLDCMLLSCMVDDPKQVTLEQVKKQIKQLDYWMLAHAYCSVLMPKVSFLQELSEQWMLSEDAVEKRCGYLMLYEIAKNNKKLNNEYFSKYLNIIGAELQSQENFVKDAMNNCIWMIGSRSKELHALALQIAKQVGKVEVDYGDNSCEALNAEKHLMAERTLKKIGVL